MFTFTKHRARAVACRFLLALAAMPGSAVAAPTACIVPPLDPMPAMSSGFGPRGSGWHAGIDLPAMTGTPVFAVAPGTVVRASPHPAFGRVVVQRLGDGSAPRLGVYAIYAHLHSYTVEPGRQVGAGSQLGTVGNTGRSTGPHLHFSILVDVPDAKIQLAGPLGVRERAYAVDPESLPGCYAKK